MVAPGHFPDYIPLSKGDVIRIHHVHKKLKVLHDVNQNIYLVRKVNWPAHVYFSIPGDANPESQYVSAKELARRKITDLAQEIYPEINAWDPDKVSGAFDHLAKSGKI